MHESRYPPRKTLWQLFYKITTVNLKFSRRTVDPARVLTNQIAYFTVVIKYYVFTHIYRLGIKIKKLINITLPLYFKTTDHFVKILNLINKLVFHNLICSDSF